MITGYPKRVSNTGWLYAWTSTESEPTFSIYKNGVFVTSQKRNSITLNVVPADMIQVFDNADNPAEGNDPDPTIHWASVATAARYRIEKETSPGSGSWNHVATVEDLGQSTFTHRVPLVDDVETSFRVTPVGVNGNDGTAASFQVTIPRHPDPPDVNFAFSDVDSKVTVTAA